MGAVYFTRHLQNSNQQSTHLKHMTAIDDNDLISTAS